MRSKLLKEVNFNSISNPPALLLRRSPLKFPPLPHAQIRFIGIPVRGLKRREEGGQVMASGTLEREEGGETQF